MHREAGEGFRSYGEEQSWYSLEGKLQEKSNQVPSTPGIPGRTVPNSSWDWQVTQVIPHLVLNLRFFLPVTLNSFLRIMHRALNFPEIVYMIVNAINSRAKKRTLARLARTSHIFREQALDALWHTLEDLQALARCMPEHTWEEFMTPRPHSDGPLTSIVSVRPQRLHVNVVFT
jgi:hypothetical protein